MIYSSNVIREKVIMIALAMLVILGLVSCTTAAHLQGNVADPSNIVASGVADSKFNVARFESFGPYSYQIYGYVLYGDDTDVRTISIPLAKLGKMNLKEVLNDYDGYRLKTGWYPASPPVIREWVRSGKLMALTASDSMLEVNLWEDTTASEKENKTVIKLSYRDLRRLDKDGGGSVPESIR
jgi:hypothetical protein